MVKKLAYAFLLLVFTFIFSISYASAGSLDTISLVSQKEITPLGNNVPTGIIISPDGSRLYTSDWGGIAQYQLSTPFNITTASYVSNLTYGNNYTFSFFLTSDGTKLYTTRFYNSKSNEIFYYDLPVPYSISSAVLNNSFILSSVNNIVGLWFSTDGSKMLLLTYDGASTYKTIYYTLTHPYYPDVVTSQNQFIRSNVQLEGSVYFDGTTFIDCSGTGDAVIEKADIITPFDISTLSYTGYYSLGSTTNCGGMQLIDKVGVSDLIIIRTSTTSHLYLEDYSFNNTMGEEAVANSSYSSSIISPFLSIFPEASTLTFKQKIGFTFITMILLALILIIISATTTSGVPQMMLWIIAVLETGAFFFFVGIGYINIGIVIMMALVLIAIAYFKFSGNRGGS
jgi:hypothetical protein